MSPKTGFSTHVSTRSTRLSELMKPTTLYATPEGAFCVVFQVTTMYFLPPTVCDFAVALFAAAPLRNPHGVVQISSCCAHEVFCAVMFCCPAVSAAVPPVT